MDLTMAIGAGLYMITCSVSDKIYIGQTECLLYRLGRHANELVKNNSSKNILIIYIRKETLINILKITSNLYS